ncbi:MAG TPA: M28 family peptidase, partial [Terriglobales bacterium]|nr:M28 family peptidase [Terriglobales bacterium]
PAAAAAAPAGAAARVNPARAMQYVGEIVGMGPRPVGSSGHRKLEDYLRAHLKSDNVETDEFTATTPAGAFPMRNYIARYPGTKDGVIVIATHYDTIFSQKDFLGANDGGSGTGLLLELANQFRGGKREGPSVWVVWLDGEEAFQKWSATDSVYGSRHLAEKWQKDGTAKKLKALILLDMIGDADLNIERDSNSTPALLGVIEQAATRLGYQSHFFRREIEVEDDHRPFARAGVPVADLIDFDYGYGNAFWHTKEDTLDKLSPRSLEIVGNVVLESVRMLGQ